MTMDDPNLIPNSPGIETEHADTTSMSPSKRTIVLGVVNTSGMKSINLNRKRRWDQPPDESGEAPSAKMVHLNESPESSCDHALARISEEPPDASAQCIINNCNEPDNLQRPASPCEKIKSDDNLMLVDEPHKYVCDRLSWPDENSSSGVTSSDQNECERTFARPIAEFSDSVSDEKVSSLSELRIDNTDQSDNTYISTCVSSEEPVVVTKECCKESEIIPTNVVSHRSDELRRIMFSYNEGMSDSDTSDSTVLSPNFDNNKTGKVDHDSDTGCLSKINPPSEINPNNNLVEDCTPAIENSVAKVEFELPSQSDLLNENNEKPVMLDPKSCNVTASNVEICSVVAEKNESHFNIPSKNESDLTLAKKSHNCVDNIPAGLLNEKDVPLSLKPSDEISSENELVFSDHPSSNVEMLESTTKEDNLSEIVECIKTSNNLKKPNVHAIHEKECVILDSNESFRETIDCVSVGKEKNVGHLEGSEKDDDPVLSTENIELSSRIPLLNDPEVKSEMTESTMELMNPETSSLEKIPFSEPLPVDEDPPATPVYHDELKLPNDMSDESQETKQGLDSNTDVREVETHLLHENSFENKSSCFDDVNSNKLDLEMEKEFSNKVGNVSKQLRNEDESENMLLPNDLSCEYKTEKEEQLPNNVENVNKTDSKSIFDESGNVNDILSNSLKSKNTEDVGSLNLKESVTDVPLPTNILVASKVPQNVDSIKCNDLHAELNLGPAEKIEGRKLKSKEEENNSVQSAPELPAIHLNESNNPSNSIDPEVIKVIFGSVDQSSKGVDNMKHDFSAGPSRSDSNGSKMFSAAPPNEPLDTAVKEIHTLNFNDIDNSSVLEHTNFPETPVKIPESNILSDMPESLQRLEEIEPSVVESDETIFEEPGGNSVLVEDSPTISLPFDVTDADASLDSTSIITSARDLEREEADIDTQEDILAVKVTNIDTQEDILTVKETDIDTQEDILAVKETNIDTEEDILAVKSIEGVVTVMDDDDSLMTLEKNPEVLEDEIESITTEVLEEEINTISTGKCSPVISDEKINELNESGDVKSIETGILMPSTEIIAVESQEEKSVNIFPNPNLKETSVTQVNNIDVSGRLILATHEGPTNDDTVYEELFDDPNSETSLLGNKLCSNKEFNICEEDVNTELNKPSDASPDDGVLKIDDTSSNIINESSNEEDNKVITEEIESFDVIEEIVTCEPTACDTADADIEVVNEDDNAQFATEETQESVESSDDLLAVIDNDTSDAHVSDNDNQNNVIIETSAFINTDENLYADSDDKTTIQAVKSVEIELNIISEKSSPEKMDCDETPVNTNNEIEASPVEEPMEVEESAVQIRSSSKIPSDTPFSAVLKSVNESEFPKDKSLVNIPLLKTVSSPPERNEKTDLEKVGKIDSLPLESSEAFKLEPLTLKIYKDSLTIKTDELDSPKKHKSPKLQSDSKILHSPQIKSLESTGSLSPHNKQFEYTLKIAKDANTNIPKATMSPKNMSPSSSWKLERGSLSPSSPGETGLSLKLKLSKPSPSGFSSDSCPSLPSVLKNKQTSPRNEEHSNNKLEKKEDVTSLPKPSLEIGSALKLIMEGEKSEVKTSGSSILEQVLSSSSNDGTGIKKRGRPRKPVEIETLPVNNSPPPGGGEGEPILESPSLDTSGDDPGSSRQVRSCRARTQPILVKPRKPRGGGTAGSTRGGGRGGARGVARPIASAEEAEKIQEKLSEKEKAELAKIEARKEKMRLDRIAKNEAKKAKKLAKKLKDEERRKRQAAEKAEKAAAAAPQVFEEETRMSASESRGHTPAPLSRLLPPSEGMEESQSSITMNTPKTGNHKGRMEIPIDPESDEVRVDQLAEYQWQGSELCMIQEQVSNYLGVKSFKRKYPDLKRRLVEAEERTFLEDSGLVPKSMCDLGLTAVSSAEILDIMFQDFPDKYEEFRQYVRDKQAREMSFKQKALASQTQSAKAKGELRELALEAAAMWNSNLNRERREERRCALDLQTFTVHYPKYERDRMVRNPLRPGLYPVAVIPGQFSDYYKTYTPTELMYFPLNTVMYGPLKPNERRDGSDSSSSSSDDSSGPSSSDESDDEDSASKECKICNGEKKTTTDSVPEILLQCSQCKGLCHPTCQEITPEMLPHIKKYSWHCSNCKQCVHCKNASKEEKKLFCDLCDRGYHLSCVGLKKSPEGRWHCSVCSYCTVCGSKDPGGPEWFYEYKKTEKGVRLYQRTLCAPCSKNALL